MNKTVHTIAGAVPFVLLTAACPEGFEVLGGRVLPIVAITTSIVASPLPDFDLKSMHFSQGKKGLGKKVAQLKTKAVNKVTGGHRGITHTLLFPVLFAVAYFICQDLLSKYYYLCSFVGSLIFGLFSGWSLHLFADMFNGKGCPLLWPIIKKKIPGVDLPSTGVVPYIWLFMYTLALYFIILQ